MALDKAALEESLALAADDDIGLTVAFYDRLFADHPSVRPLFGNDIRPQAQMLQQAIVAVLDHVDDPAWLGATLGELGRKHASWGVTEPMYGWVATALIATMAERAGSRWTPEMLAAWTEALEALATIMLAAYPVRTDNSG